MSGKPKSYPPELVAEFEASLRVTRSITAASAAIGLSKSVGQSILMKHPRLRSLVAGRGERPGCHGLRHTPEYRAWSSMRSRCNGTGGRDHWRWGGRGIRVCGGWNDFLRFLSSVGRRPTPSHSLDRIDNNGHYSCGKCEECVANGWPANCRWATAKEQAANRSNNTLYTLQGRTLPLNAWARELGISQGTLWRRLNDSKWPVERAFTEPLHNTRSNSCL